MKIQYWYKYTFYTCQVCGDGKSFKERVVGDKPKNKDKRYEHVLTYCGCMDGELYGRP